MTGLSFRRFLSPARSRPREKEPELRNPWTGELQPPSKPEKKQRSRSWMPSSRRNLKSPEPTEFRRARTDHRMNISLPQNSFDKPFASTYSLPSSKEARKVALTGTPSSDVKAASTLCLLEPTQRLRPCSPLSQPPRPSIGLVSPPNADFSFSSDSPRPSLSLSIPPASQSDNQSTRSVSPPNDKDSIKDSMSIVESLVLKSEEAFVPVGLDLKDVPPIPQSHRSRPNSPSPPPRLSERKLQAPMPSPLRYAKDQRSRDIPSPLASPIRKASVMKPQRKKSVKRPAYRGAPPRRKQMRGPRSWKMPENVTEILTGQRFKRIVADEMLTPKQLEQLKKNRQQAELEEETRMMERESCDSGRSLLSEVSSESPGEPFHLEDLPSRIGASGVEVDTFLDEPSPCTPPGEDSQDFSVEMDSASEEIYLKPVAFQPQEEMAIVPEPSSAAVHLAPLPVPHPARLGLSALPLKKPLPSIPEVATPICMGPSPMERRREQRRLVRERLQPKEKDGILYVHSTPYTLTTPAFRHGPIAVSKTEPCQGMMAMMDENLDWTAFQMAILCGAGDLFPDLTCEEDMKQATDITTWFDSFGFESGGQLVPEDVPTLSSGESSRSIISLSSSTADVDTELPIPVASEYPSGFWNSPLSNASSDREKFFHNQGLKRWAGEGHPKPYIQRNSMDSGPPSPMLPLVIRTGGLEGDDPVPMGYNLHHDLGEFLRWESENVYANGYYGSP